MTTSSAVDEFFAFEDRRFRAMVDGDVTALDELLEDDLHYVHANGVVEDKAEFIRKITSGERQYRQFRATKRDARQEEGFVFIFGEADVEVDRAAGNLKNALTYTAIYRDAATPQLGLPRVSLTLGL